MDFDLCSLRVTEPSQFPYYSVFDSGLNKQWAFRCGKVKPVWEGHEGEDAHRELVRKAKEEEKRKKAEAKKELILEAAKNVVGRLGYSKATLDDIAAAIGMKKPGPEI